MSLLRSIVAVGAGLIFIVVSHSFVDLVLETVGIFPPRAEGLHVTWMLVLATFYRTALSILGCNLAAYLAPGKPMLHALILGAIGLFAAGSAAIYVIPMNMSPAWYPIALAIVALPCGWLGGKIREYQLGL